MRLADRELQRTPAAWAGLAQLNDCKTDELLPEIREQLADIAETLDSLVA